MLLTVLILKRGHFLPFAGLDVLGGAINHRGPLSGMGRYFIGPAFNAFGSARFPHFFFIEQGTGFVKAPVPLHGGFFVELKSFIFRVEMKRS